MSQDHGRRTGSVAQMIAPEPGPRVLRPLTGNAAKRRKNLLIWPEKVHVGRVFTKNKTLRSRLELINSLPYPASVPIRTLNMEARAGFYATIKRRIPFRFDNKALLENVRIFRVGELPEQD